ncbi:MULTISPECIES: hypothetical protein [unclassified Streptomyces]|uniref:hypothetical protein n=1 Tax=unclassified Streptomyces TaxID=2593676 RepID=UPI002E2C65E4|nr:hypothetical protein [Streptomyces sp. NBC_00273]
MLEETLTALAAAGGTAVVQAAGTSTWQGFQQAVSRWFGHGDEEAIRVDLDRSAQMLAAAREDDDVMAVRDEQAAWQTRFAVALASLAEPERRSAAEALAALIQATPHADGVSAAGDGLAVRGKVEIRADHGSVAALRMGDVSLGNPSQSGPPQG